MTWWISDGATLPAITFCGNSDETEERGVHLFGLDETEERRVQTFVLEDEFC